MKKGNVIWGAEEYLYKADCTLQSVIINNSKVFYVLNAGNGYENIFESMIDVTNYLDCKRFNRLATIADDETSSFIEDLADLLAKYKN